MSLIDIEDWREMIRILRFLERLKTNAIAIAILISILLNPTFVIADEFDTIVYIDPSDQIVSPEENFTVNVSCVPDQPIKSFEFGLSFDSSLLIANSVTEGNIFDGYDTFFAPCRRPRQSPALSLASALQPSTVSSPSSASKMIGSFPLDLLSQRGSSKPTTANTISSPRFCVQSMPSPLMVLRWPAPFRPCRGSPLYKPRPLPGK